MKRTLYAIPSALFTFCALNTFPLYGEKPFQIEKPETQVHLSEKDQLLQLSEAFGHFIGRNLTNPGINFDLERMITGIRNGAEGKPAPMTDQEYEQLLAMFQAKSYFELADKNLEASNEYLYDNSRKPGVNPIIENKLQYEILKPGTGRRVYEDDSPTINFTAKLLDGTIVGSTTKEEGPVSVSLEQTLPGIQKGILGMREGEARRLFIHPELGYGMSGQLPPNALLIVDVELIKTNPPSSTDQTDDTKQNEEGFLFPTLSEFTIDQNSLAGNSPNEDVELNMEIAEDSNEDSEEVVMTELLARYPKEDELNVQDLIAEENYLNEYDGYSEDSVYDEPLLRLPKLGQVPDINYDVDRSTNSETIIRPQGNSPLDDKFEVPGW